MEPVRSTTGMVHWVDTDGASVCHQGIVGGRPCPGYPVTCKNCLRAMGPLERIKSNDMEVLEDRKVLGQALRRIAAGEVDDSRAAARIALAIVDARHAARERRHVWYYTLLRS